MSIPGPGQPGLVALALAVGCSPDELDDFMVYIGRMNRVDGAKATYDQLVNALFEMRRTR